MSVFVANEQSDAPVDEERLADLALAAMEAEGVAEGELSILLVDRDVMAELNERYHPGGHGPTDVLAFPMDELDTARGPEETEPGPALLGDVVLCPEVARRQAAQAGHSVADELHMLCVHGVLHLLGYDHGEPDEEREMFTLQGRLLDGWRTASRGGHSRSR